MENHISLFVVAMHGYLKQIPTAVYRRVVASDFLEPIRMRGNPAVTNQDGRAKRIYRLNKQGRFPTVVKLTYTVARPT